MSVRVMQGDCREVLRTLDTESVDACVTDPPYGLGFMGNDWDSFAPEMVGRQKARRQRKGTERSSERWPTKLGTTQGGGVAIRYDESAGNNARFQAWCADWAREVYRVLKPGAHLVAFGGTRTFHRLTCGIEDAGFEIRDCLIWMFGSGFPKSHNLPGGLGTALKPGWEPIVLARKPLIGTVAANVARYGTGALTIDGCRIGDDGGCKYDGPSGSRQQTVSTYGNGLNGLASARVRGLGRWPANVALDADAAVLLDTSVPASQSRSGQARKSAQPGNGYGMTHTGAEYDDAGGPSRFFYIAKASRAERNRGLEGMPERQVGMVSNTSGQHITRRDGGEPVPAANHHPTVKPVALMQWLVRLVTPAGRLVLDPFAGSGTTGIAAEREGMDTLLIEREEEYVEIIRRRIVGDAPLFASVETAP